MRQTAQRDGLMKSPLWILNSILVFFLLVFLICIAFLRPFRPKRISLAETAEHASRNHSETIQLDPSQIYKNDLFATYAETKVPTPTAERIIPIAPTPPAPREVPKESKQQPQFLAPLGVVVKGIMYSRNDAENRAIIADSKSKKETLCRVGDTILDAEIIHIGRNKVIFIRSNGQQETLFLTPSDAQKDPVYRQKDPWTKVVEQTSETSFVIHYDEFMERVSSFAAFMDLLDITTAFQEGKIIGCRIGGITSPSLGTALGLRSGDIVLSVNKIPTNSTQQRIAIFNQITALQGASPITVLIKRSSQELTLHYTIKLPQHGDHAIQEQTALSEQPSAPHKESIDEKIPVTIAETQLQDTQKKDRQAMLNYGGRTPLVQHALSQGS